MLLLMAGALLVAQSINLALLLSETRSRRANFVAGGVVARATDVVERIELGLQLPRAPTGAPDRMEVTLGSLDRSAGASRETILEQRLAEALRSAGHRFRAVQVSKLERVGDRDELVVSVQLLDGRWANLKSTLPPGDTNLIIRLILQTIIIFLALLLPVFLIGRHVTGPLRKLRRAAGALGRPGQQDPVAVDGPGDVRLLIASFNQMAARIGNMLEEKDRMLGAIGHDLRTPIASLRLRVETVADAAERERMIETLEEMARTLEDILSLARIGRAADPLVKTDLGGMVDSLVQDLQDMSMPVQLSCSPRLLAMVRPAPLRRAIRNVIENAVTYGSSAEVTLEQSGEHAVITVRDHGPGIPEGEMERVFEGFVRLETSRSKATGGSGLGLTLARGIVSDLNGTLTLEDARPGLLVRLKLPLAG